MWQGPRDIDLRVEAFLEMFEKKLVEMTVDEFQVRAVIIPVGCICKQYNSLIHMISSLICHLYVTFQQCGDLTFF